MDNQLHAAGERAGRPRKDARRRAGLPAKRFYTRFAALSDVPPEDLELLAERLRAGLTADPSSPVPALQALVRREIRKRGDAASG
ncbi:hypothetical protein ACJJV6_10220 [Arthrobacter nitrophenolicus]|jgi:hypothetical protein|uniref:Uncharacterized protein n=2 Tax=Arthrobacter nitrophenolicus TaxID=683150 RepID=L8TL73_9MICC|nr:hypothetical protein [Arthrobacter nitrophenolicus]ELT42645.1 hypothetical protein G205_23187 [Arthrobacter nitrophenolicus]TDL37826.1 hypothetical protein E2R57_08715 [Arthrobacter nitrophenolicus]